VSGPTPERLASSGTEHGQQAALFAWANAIAITDNRYQYLNYMFAIPNGGTRRPSEAARFKAEGVKAGVPDILLPHPSFPYNGLFIEMKKSKGRLSPQQQCWIDYLISVNYRVEVCYSFEEAKSTILDYLST